MKILLHLPLLLILSLGACKNNNDVSSMDYNSIPPIVLLTSLKDSLSPKVLATLKLRDVTGIKIQYATGMHASYFEYEASAEILLQSISHLPFSIHASLADTGCKQIPIKNLDSITQKISAIEFEQSEFFWNVNQEDLTVYECVKAPYRHTLLVKKNSNRILHRVEFFG